MMYLIVPLLVTVSAGVTQSDVVRLLCTWRLKPVEGDGQETRTAFEESWPMFKATGAWSDTPHATRGYCMAMIMLYPSALDL